MEKGEDRKEEKPTNTATISIVQLVEENVRPSFNVRCCRANKRPLHRLIHPQGQRAGQSPSEGIARADAPH
jgi:hypothetical protein